MKKKERDNKLAKKEQDWQYLFPELAPRKKKNSDEIHPKNKLNDLTGKEWVQFTKSWFLFNALASDLKEERLVTKGQTAVHPATFSPTMISEFICFFTKRGQTVLDPFVGTGTTTIAAARCGRNSIGVEVDPYYWEMASRLIGDATQDLFSRVELNLHGERSG